MRARIFLLVITTSSVSMGALACGSADRGGVTSAALRDAASDGANGTGDGGGAVRDVDASDGAAKDAGGGEGSVTDGALPDGSSAGGGVPCGASFCREGAVCASGQCELPPCTGYTVPGDYATVQAAASALASTGGTICVGEGTFAEDVGLYVQPAARVVLRGVSASKTTIRSIDMSNGVDVMGVTFTNASTITDPAGTISNARFMATTGTALSIVDPSNGSHLSIKATTIAGQGGGLRVDSVYGVDLTIDACDISASSSGAAVLITETTSSIPNGPVVVDITNTWIHAAAAGVRFTAYRGCTACPPGTSVTDTITIDNVTFTDNGTAIEATTERPGTQTLGYFNSLFTTNQLGVKVMTPNIVQAKGNNLFFGNVANYDGAVDGPGYVKQDPALEFSRVVPGLKGNSAARGTADPAHAPATDYWGRTRVAADIGAVAF